MEIEKGVLHALGKMPDTHPKLTKKLLDDDAKQTFARWIKHHGRLIFSEKCFQFWQDFSKALASDDIKDEICKIIENTKSSKYQDEDINNLKNFISLFPDEINPPEPDTFYGKWLSYLRLYKKFWESKNSISQYLPVSVSELDELESDLSKSNRIPFIRNLHQLWQTAWRKELVSLRTRLENINKYTDTDDKNLSQLIKGFFYVIRQVHFVRGRFYRFIEFKSNIIEKSESPRSLMLELIAIEGKPKCKLPYLGYLLEGDDNIDVYKTDKNIIPFKLCFHDAPEISNNKENQQWDELINKGNNEKLWLQIPISYKQGDENKVLGIFAFDWENCPIDASIHTEAWFQRNAKEKLQKVNDELNVIATNIAKAILAEERWKKLKKLQQINKLDESLFKTLERNQIEELLLKKAIEITDASGGLLINVSDRFTRW